MTMDEQEYKIFLLCAAKEVETLPAAQKKLLLEQLQIFYNKLKLWYKADKAVGRKIKQYQEDAKAHLETLPIIKVLYKRSCDKPNVFRQIAQILNKYGFKTRDGKTKRWKASTVENIIKSKYSQYRKVMEKGWIREKIWVHDYIVRRDVKIPKHCPLDWLSLHKVLGYKLYPGWFSESEPEPCKNDEERLLARYVLLAIIQEKVLIGPRAVRLSNGIWPEDEEWVEDVWSELAQPDTLLGLSVEDEVRTEIEIALRLVKADLDAGTPKDREKVKTQTRVKNNWKSPKGYIGSQTIILSTVGELKEKLKLPHQGDEEYKIPRSTLGGWQSKDSKAGGELEGNIKRDPSTYEVYCPNKWFKKQIMKYIPKVRKP